MATAEPLDTIRKYREGSIALETATLKLALYDDSTAYSIDRVNHIFLNDVLDGGVTAQELGDASYSRQSVANVQVTKDGTDVEVVVDADDVTFPSVDGGEVVQGWILYRQVGADDTTPGDDDIIAIEDEVKNSSGNDVTTNGSDIVVQFAGEGVINTS